MTKDSSSVSSSNNKKVVWFRQSNLNSFDEKEKQEWERFSDFEIEFIEVAFQRKQKEVEINDYFINFQQNMQFKKTDRNRQRLVKREENDRAQYVREERFKYPERANKSFNNSRNMDQDLVYQWYSKHKQTTENCSAIAELAAEGKYG